MVCLCSGCLGSQLNKIKVKELPLETKNTLQIENGSIGFIETLHKHNTAYAL